MVLLFIVMHARNTKIMPRNSYASLDLDGLIIALDYNLIQKMIPRYFFVLTGPYTPYTLENFFGSTGLMTCLLVEKSRISWQQ
jgi:hypothetical protein